MGGAPDWISNIQIDAKIQGFSHNDNTLAARTLFKFRTYCYDRKCIRKILLILCYDYIHNDQMKQSHFWGKNVQKMHFKEIEWASR